MSVTNFTSDSTITSIFTRALRDPCGLFLCIISNVMEYHTKTYIK